MLNYYSPWIHLTQQMQADAITKWDLWKNCNAKSQKWNKNFEWYHYNCFACSTCFYVWNIDATYTRSVYSIWMQIVQHLKINLASTRYLDYGQCLIFLRDSQVGEHHHAYGPLVCVTTKFFFQKLLQTP